MDQSTKRKRNLSLINVSFVLVIMSCLFPIILILIKRSLKLVTGQYSVTIVQDVQDLYEDYLEELPDLHHLKTLSWGNTLTAPVYVVIRF